MGSTFPAADDAAWRALVDKVLKGADVAERLVHPTADGIAVGPLYTEAEAGALRAAVGHGEGVPPVRGGTAALGAGWDIRQRNAEPDPAVANAQILEELEGGATSVQLRLAAAGAPDLARRLEGVLLDLAPVGLEAGAGFGAAGRALLELCRARGLDPAQVRADLNADPLGAAASGEALALDGAMAQAADLALGVADGWPQVAALVADGRLYHGGGATEAQEVAFAVATGIAYLRLLATAGLAPERAARQIGFALAADADFFLTVAKLRALRRAWARVLEVVGAAGAMADLRLRAETATRMTTRRDRHVNILRGTVAAFAAAAGGATSITVLPFDHAVGLPSRRARRIARNTQLVLLEESRLGHVADPAGGSWYVEHLTEALAVKAWSLVQRIEAAGGMAAAIGAGLPHELVAASWTALRQRIATRRDVVTGVSSFPDLAEPPLPVTGAAAAGEPRITPRRLAEPFEALRDRSDAALARDGKRPRAFLCNLGRPADFAARADFARNLLEVGGIVAVMSEPLATGADAGPALAASGLRLAAICASDEMLEAAAADAARSLRQAGARRVLAVGRPRPSLAAAGIDEHVCAGADVLGTLERAHAALAGEAA